MCRLTDEDGNQGWGEAVTIAPEAARATTVMLKSWAEQLPGTEATPAAVGLFAERLGWWYGTQGGASGFARAALDTASWDLLGKRLGGSVVDLLGGARHQTLPIITTGHAMRADLDEGADEFATWAGSVGAAGVKVGFGKAGEAHLGFDHDRDVAFMSRLRRALGDTAQIMIDISPRVQWSPAAAIRRVRAFEDHGLHWIEEPLGARNPEGYQRLRDATTTLLAYGEREWDVPGMAEILATGTVDVLGIDPGRAGGISGFRDGATLAASHCRQVNAHAFAGPISYAAGLAVSLASTNCHQFEVAPLQNTLLTELTSGLKRPIDGTVSALQGPGLGVEVDVDRLEAIAE
ncbi:MAG: mandelate racemase/muconate lactonizing enzyme family protein [Propioniciclava sp.]